MLSKNQIKHYSALHLKKNRETEGLFLVEGEKIAAEVLLQQHFKIRAIVALPDWIEEHQKSLSKQKYEIYPCSETDLERISTLKTPNRVVLVMELPESKGLRLEAKGKKTLVLDQIQDPGNLGTIIRIADWFGFSDIVCSPDTVELYNPKVLQSTMGSFLRVQLHYTPLEEVFKVFPDIPRYGAVLHGKNVFEAQFPQEAFLLIGNEGKGLSEAMLQQVQHPISIPKFGGAESLNAAVATGILCAFLRK